MSLNLDDLVAKYGISLKGILHIGAHEAEECPSYLKYLSHQHILWIEAQPFKVDICKRKYPEINIETDVVSDVVEEVTFNISNNGQSSSFLNLGTHKVHHPGVYYTS